MIISLIVAIDEAGGIGKHNQLLCHLPADLKHFKTITMGKPIIMGRKTFESIGRPLPGRRNIVLSRQALAFSGVEVVPSLNDALSLLGDVSEAMIIGGVSVFEEAFPMAQRLYLTRIHHRFEADVFFPSFSSEQWHSVSEHHRERDDQNPYDMTFYQYNRVV